MCGRYVITSAPEAIRALFRYQEQPNFPPRFNVAPASPFRSCGSPMGAAIRAGALGLLPSWVKDPKTFSLLINARGESVIDKPAFRAAMKRRRCLIRPTFSTSGRRRRAQAALLYSLEVGGADGFRWPLGNLDRTEWRRA